MGTHFSVASAAIDGAALRGVKRDGRNLCAFRAGCGDFYSLPDAGGLGHFNGSQSLILGLFALFATLRGILELLITEERLFTGSPRKLTRAVDAVDR